MSIFNTANKLSAIAHKASLDTLQPAHNNEEGHSHAAEAHYDAQEAHVHAATNALQDKKYVLAVHHGIVSMKHGHAAERHEDFEAPEAYYALGTEPRGTIEQEHRESRRISDIADFAPIRGTSKRALQRRIRENEIASGYHSTSTSKAGRVLSKLHSAAVRVLQRRLSEQ